MCESSFRHRSNIFTHAQQAKNWLQTSDQNNLIAYPTESVWGIGCDAMNQEAVVNILTIKNRPHDKGMIVVTNSIERIQPLLADLTESQRKIITHSWNDNSDISTAISKKQAITWLLPIPKGVTIPHWITGKHNSVAVRVTAHPLIKQVCKDMVSEQNPFGFIISTSCNPATLTPARTLKQAQDYFSKYDNIGYLQAETLGYDLPSQIRDAVTGLIIR